MDGDKRFRFQRWLMQSRRDLKAAELLRDHGAYEWAVLSAQLAAERVLKAYLFLQGDANIVEHSIRSLVHKCAAHSPAFDAAHDAGRLDEFYLAPRFPDDFSEEVPADAVQPEDAGIAVELAQLAVDVVAKFAEEE